MALADVQQITNSYIQGIQARLAQQREASEAELRKQQGARMQAETEQATKALEEQRRQFDLAHKAAIAQHELESSKFLQSLQGQNPEASGFTPTGQEVNPQVQTTIPPQQGNEQIPYAPSSGVGTPQSRTFTTPYNSLETGQPKTVSIMTPEAMAQQQSRIGEILAGPARRTEQVKLEQEAKNQQALAKLNQTAETARSLEVEDRRTKAELERTRIMTGATLKAALYAQGIGLPGDEETTDSISHVSDSLLNGTISREAAQNLGGIGKAATRGIMSQGGVPLSQKQIDTLTSLKNAASIIPLMEDFISKQKGGNLAGTGFNPVGSIANVFNAGQQQTLGQIHSKAVEVGKLLSAETGRISNMGIQLAEGGFEPHPGKSPELNRQQLNFFKDQLLKGAEDKLGNLPEKQRNIVMQNYGIFDAINPKAPAQASPQGTASPVIDHSKYLQPAGKY